MSCFNPIINDDHHERPKPKPEPKPNPGPGGENFPFKPNTDKANEEHYSLWTSMLSEMPDHNNDEKPFGMDKSLGYVLGLGKYRNADKTPFSTEEVQQRLMDAKNKVKDIPDKIEIMSSNGHYLDKKPYRKQSSKFDQTFEEYKKLWGAKNIQIEDWLRWNQFTISRTLEDDTLYPNWTENDWAVLVIFNGEIWKLYTSMYEKDNDLLNSSSMISSFLTKYCDLMLNLMKELTNNNLSIKEQIGPETKRLINSVITSATEFLNKDEHLLIEMGNPKNIERYFFEIGSSELEYEPGWRFNRIVQLLNEFLIPLGLASGVYANVNETPFWKVYEKEAIWYPKYLFGKQDVNTGIWVNTLKRDIDIPKAMEALRKFAKNEVSFDLRFNDNIE
ncbi:hypothetical protein DP065_01450 [[Mycoplasma] anseris]|uniref:Uncharacterized protein n=2 Tax=[Mycoplasma] anseris TaxID=92400 RepID=A0A2Z4ND30_9BACT|nr:hypothetical protein DP065_01450 [[Mycoplasma] anseris]